MLLIEACKYHLQEIDIKAFIDASTGAGYLLHKIIPAFLPPPCKELRLLYTQRQRKVEADIS